MSSMKGDPRDMRYEEGEELLASPLSRLSACGVEDFVWEEVAWGEPNLDGE